MIKESELLNHQLNGITLRVESEVKELIRFIVNGNYPLSTIKEALEVIEGLEKLKSSITSQHDQISNLGEYRADSYYHPSRQATPLGYDGPRRGL